MMRAWHCTLRVTQHEAKLLLSSPEEGDLLIFTKGDMRGVSGGTNAMTILRVTSQ